MLNINSTFATFANTRPFRTAEMLISPILDKDVTANYGNFRVQKYSLILLLFVTFIYPDKAIKKVQSI